MYLLPTVCFWSSLGLIAYTYAGYPLLIQAAARWRRREVRRGTWEPTVTVILPARDEERHLQAKLENLLALDYPREKLQLLVVSDGSGDGTEAIAAAYAHRGVELLCLAAGGKPTALNRGAERARGEVLVFCDARQRLAPDALRRLLEPLVDPRVGAVSGDLQLATRRGPGIYWAYERRIRLAESAVDSTIGVSGSLMALRRQLFRPVPAAALLDDVYLPMQVVLQGYRVIHQASARVFDEEADLEGEFARKARTLAGNYQLLQLMPDLLSMSKNRVFLQYVSHKVLRLICPFALATLLLSNGVLVLTLAPPFPLYAAALLAQLSGYGLALWGALRGERAGRLARGACTFVTLNAAAVEGLRRFLVGDLSWTTARPAGASR